METRKLYYEDSHLFAFTAIVTACETVKNGYEIVLDATAFYPEGGGQPCDLGTLNGIAVLDVRERGETVVHLCASPLTVGQTVEGILDEKRRFDLMQQHAGEHIVSGLVHKHFGYHNVGFHMGKVFLEIDFDGPLTYEQLLAVEREANEAVWRDAPIRCWYPGPEELSSIPYRSKKALPWPVRIVEVPGVDMCACCGVHVASTGQIGLIKLLSCVKFHQGVRVQMLCGGRALDYMNEIFAQNRLVSQVFSAKPLETGAAAVRMNEALGAEKFRAAGLEKQVFAHIAESYANQENVLHFAEDLTPAAVWELADAIAGKISGVAAVLSGSDEKGYSVCLVSRQEDVRPLGKAMADALRGRGGGKKEAFQGSLKAGKGEIEAFFRGI